MSGALIASIPTLLVYAVLRAVLHALARGHGTEGLSGSTI